MLKCASAFLMVTLVFPRVFAEATPLYKMGQEDVVIVEGNVERKPQISHKTHELDSERSSPFDDPSPQFGYHFALRKMIPQTDIGKKAALGKLDPISNNGFLVGGFGKSRNALYYRTRFTGKDPIVSYLRKKQSEYQYGGFTLGNGPTLVNSDYEFDGISDRAFGFCWGFSTLNRYFAYAAFFDPGLQAPVSYVPNGRELNEAWFKFYEPIIDDIMNAKPRIIPGFRNFFEFTSIPEIEFYLKLKAMRAWANRAISVGSLSTFFTSTEELTSDQMDELVEALRVKLSRGELPKVLFTAADSRKQFGGTLDVHSVLVNGVMMNADGTGQIFVWDINFYFPDLIRDPKILEIVRSPYTGKREIHYRPWLEVKSSRAATFRSSLLGKVRISPEDESEMGALIRHLKAFCNEADHAKKYCGLN